MLSYCILSYYYSKFPPFPKAKMSLSPLVTRIEGTSASENLTGPHLFLLVDEGRKFSLKFSIQANIKSREKMNELSSELSPLAEDS